jgi:hypothetical protein
VEVDNVVAVFCDGRRLPVVFVVRAVPGAQPRGAPRNRKLGQCCHLYNVIIIIIIIIVM